MTAILSAFLFLLPFIHNPFGLDQFRLPKEIYANAGIVLLGAVLTWKMAPLPRFALCSLEALMGVGLLLAVVWAGIWGGLPVVGQLLYFALLFLVVRFGVDRSAWRVIWIWAGAGTAISALLTIAQRYELHRRAVAAGLIGDIGTAGVVFGLMTLVLVGLLPGTAGFWKIAGISGLAAVNFAGLVACQSLTSIGALVAAGILWAGMACLPGIRKLKVSNAILTVASLCPLAFVVFSSPRFDDLVERIKASNYTAAFSGRNVVARASLDLISERPIAGHGLGSFQKALFYRRLEQPHVQALSGTSWAQAHNEYLQAWVEMGIPGLLLTLALLVWPLVALARRVTGLPQGERQRAIGLVAAGAFFAVCALGFFPLHLAVTGVYGAVVLGGMRAACGEV